MNIAKFDSIYKMLDVINLNIVDSTKFIDYVGKQGKGIEDTIKDIKVAKEKSIKKIDYSDFERKLVNSFKEIQKEINKDGMFQYSDEEEMEKFKNFFQEIVDKYVIIYKLKDDKDECARKRKEIESLKNEINSLNKSTSPLTTNDLQKINDLNFKLGVKNLEYKKVLELIEEDIQIITRNSLKLNFINLLDELNIDLNKLIEMFSKLSLTPITRQNVDKMFLELNNSLTNEKNEYKKEINIFKEICENAGIENSVASLEKNDMVVYNGTKPYYGADNSYVLKVGQTYKVKDYKFTNNGLEEFYLEDFDKPFSVTLFDTPREWQEKKELVNGNNKEDIVSNKKSEGTKSINETNDLNNSILTSGIKEGDFVVYNGSKDYTSSKDNTNLLQTGFSYRVAKLVINEKGKEEIYLDGIDVPFSITMFEPKKIEKKHTNELEMSNLQTVNVNNPAFISSEEKKNTDEISSKLDSEKINLESNSNLTPVFKQGDFVVYNGTKDFNSNRDFTNLLQTGFSYRVTKSVINEKGEEEIYLEGIDMPFSVTMFETEEIWKEHMNGLIFQMVHKIDHKPINKEVAYTNAVMGLNNKKVTFNLKKSIHNVLGKVKSKFEKIKSVIETYRSDYESEYIEKFMTELNEYENQDRDLIDIDEFSKDFDAIKNAEKKSKSK